MTQIHDPAALRTTEANRSGRQETGPAASQEASQRSYLIARGALTFVVLVLGAASFASAWSPMVVAWGALVASAVLAAGIILGLKRTGLVGFVAALVALAVPVLTMMIVGRRAGRGLVGAFTEPFPELLTTPAPAPVTFGLLLPGLVLAWLVGVIVGLVADLRSGRNMGVLGSLTVGIVLYLGGQLLSGGEADEHGLIAAGMVLTWLADWSLWNRSKSPTFVADSRVGTHPAGAAETTTKGSGPVRGVVVAAVLALVASGGAFLQLGEPFQPQELIERNETLNQEPNPMPYISHWAKEPETEIFRRSGDNVPVHLAVMSEFDGATFRPPQRPYDPVGSNRPVSPPIAGQQEIARVNVVWPQQTRWLPAPGHPNIVSLPDAEVNPATGTLISPDIPQEGALSYSVTSVVSQPDQAQLPDAPVPDLPDYLGVPRLPDELAAYGEELTAEAESPYDKARALEAGIKNKRSFTAELPAGHSYGRLTTFLLAPESEGGRAGTSEQFATAFAVLARSQGLPTRVVVGFSAGTPLEGADGTHVVHGSDALAWPEVYFQGQGWVPFNPTPDTDQISPVAANPPQSEENPENAEQAPDENEPRPDRSANQEDGGVNPAWIVLAIILAGTLLLLGALVMARVLRRRGQRARGAVGAWQYIEDAVTLAGGSMSTQQTATERARRLDAPDDAVQIARAAEFESFAASGAASTAESAEHFERAARVEETLRGGATWWRRVVWALSPAPFLRKGSSRHR